MLQSLLLLVNMIKGIYIYSKNTCLKFAFYNIPNVFLMSLSSVCFRGLFRFTKMMAAGDLARTTLRDWSLLLHRSVWLHVADTGSPWPVSLKESDVIRKCLLFYCEGHAAVNSINPNHFGMLHWD